MKLESPNQRGKHVQMQMPGDAGAGGAAQIHSEVHAVGFVQLS